MGIRDEEEDERVRKWNRLKYSSANAQHKELLVWLGRTDEYQGPAEPEVVQPKPAKFLQQEQNSVVH